ncbi:MAG: HNH endonuclease [Clostridia bacterium]|nr:HNH endonuclease [Clostridia bacterium]
MPHTLIMPKQTGRKDVFYSSMELFYNAYISGDVWVSNEDYKKDIQKLLPSLSQGAQDAAYLVKQSELTRYFGLAYRDYPGRKTKITDRGIRFYNAYLQNDTDLQKEIIMQSIFNDSFGRNNTAIEHSNSDVDAPKLFIKAMYDLGGISRKDLAYLIYVTHDKQVSYNDALNEFKNTTEQREINIPISVSNKYSDVKFTVLLTELDICIEQNGKYFITKNIIDKYENEIKKLSIYNKEPEIVLTLSEELDFADDENLESEIEETTQKKIITSFAYDINSEKFIRQNNRVPVSFKTKTGIKYKTNPRISKTALQLANYKCQTEPEEHITFISKLGQQYMEAHHLIPMHAQKDFSINLDRIENIVSICPTCHSAIHLGNDSVRLEYLKKLYDLKIRELKSVGLNISFGELFTKYYK